MAKGERTGQSPWPWPASFSVELPGIEPVSACWPMTQSGAELGNDVDHDSPELTSMDPKCAQNVPTESRDRPATFARLMPRSPSGILHGYW